EEVFRSITERYPDAERFLAVHYLREALRTRDQELEARAAALAKEEFPRGFERASLSALSSPPTDGVVFTSFGRRVERTGLRREDVVVAVDGIRVRDYDQYMFAAQSSFEPHMRVIVWRDGRYQDIDAIVPQRWFGVTFGVYTPKPQTGKH